jgi:peptidoglycan/LPS O-acetylase OafA/YrhL
MAVLPAEESAARPAAAARRRLAAVDPLRGLACLGVLLHHTFDYQSLEFARTAVPSGPWHWPLAALSACASIPWSVNLFVVLSGFCLFYPLAARADLAAVRLDVGQFARRRARRILPPYYAALALLAVLETVDLYHRSGAWSAHAAFGGKRDVLLHLLMLHNLSVGTVGSVSPAFWSLALECQLYVLFPLLVWAAARRGIKPVLLATLLVALAWQALCWRHIGFTTVWTPRVAVYYDALPGRAFEFVAGMAAALAVVRPRAGQARAAAVLALLALPLALGYAVRSHFGPFYDQLWGVSFAALLVLLCRVPGAAFERHGLLRGLTWLGGISYSVYLIHHPLIWMISVHRMHLPGTPLGYYAAGLLRLPLLILLGSLFHRAFERPFMPGRPRTARQAEHAAAVSPAP